MTAELPVNATLAPRLRQRPLNRWRAAMGGYFWLPCPVCGEFSGGHEWKHDGLPASVPDVDQPGLSHGICPACTREGYGYPADVPTRYGAPMSEVGLSRIAKAEADATPTRWYVNQPIRHTGSLDLGNVIAVDFEENLVQIKDGRWWRMEHVVEVGNPATDCGWCPSCVVDRARFMVVCPDCGNKRCPKATHHDNPCSGSNDPGQSGSRYA